MALADHHIEGPEQSRHTARDLYHKANAFTIV